VASVLGEGAEAEIAEGAFPSPAVDTLAFWLVRRRRTDAALAVSESVSHGCSTKVLTPPLG
jgi:hypothetical protein